MFAGSFNLFLFSETLTITVLTFESFYCIFLKKMNGKFTPRVHVLSSAYTISIFKNTYKSFLYRFSGSFKYFLFTETLTITVLIMESFFLYSY